MAHKVKEKEPTPGSWIKIKTHSMLLRAVASFTKRHFADMYVAGTWVRVEYNLEDYEYTEMKSLDELHSSPRSWSDCEKHYGINVWGSMDPDPVRQLALAVLRGEGSAIDLVKDALETLAR